MMTIVTRAAQNNREKAECFPTDSSHNISNQAGEVWQGLGEIEQWCV